MARFLLELPLWPAVVAYLCLAVLCGIVARNALRSWLDRARTTMQPHLHEVLVHSLPRPVGAAVVLFVVSVGLRFFPIPAHLETLTRHILPFITGALAVVVLMRIALASILAYGDSYPQLKSSAGIGRAITWIIGLALIAVLMSDALGISLAPALTALGVGSLAVALALQDTLSNFFAGLYLLLDRPIRPGEFVRLDGGQEGYVDAIGWRSTHLRTLAPSTIIVPNATLSKAVITNFRMTNPRLTLATPIDVELSADPVAVQGSLEQELKGALEIPGVEPTPAPVVRFTFGDRGLTFTLYVTVTPAADGGLVQQELRRRAIARLRGEGVKLAEPNPFVKRP
jgi:small-conductance mechanosensitive channel